MILLYVDPGERELLYYVESVKTIQGFHFVYFRRKV